MNYYCNFSAGMWDKNDWQILRSPRWTAISSWQQFDNAIGNFVPDDLKPEDMQMGRDRTGETYISMLLKKPISGNADIAATCAFADRMAPLIVFAKELGDVHKEHLEVVLYDRGVNLWHHFWDGQKPSWQLIAHADIPLAKHEQHHLEAGFIFCGKGKFLTMSCAGVNFGCRIADDWPQTYFAGITACEGRNKFFEFTVRQDKPLSAAMAERFTD